MNAKFKLNIYISNLLLHYRGLPGFEAAQTFLPRLYAAAVAKPDVLTISSPTRPTDSLDEQLKQFPSFLASARKFIAQADRAESQADYYPYQGGMIRVIVTFKKGPRVVGELSAPINIWHGIVWLNFRGQTDELLKMRVGDFFSLERLRKYERRKGSAERALSVMAHWLERGVTMQEFLFELSRRGVKVMLNESRSVQLTILDTMSLSGVYFGKN